MRATERTLSDDVAEKVMGWHRGACEAGHQRAGTHRCEYGWEWYSANGKIQALAEPSHDYYHSRDAWSPEDDMADAWQVVEKLRERFPQVDIEILPDRVTVTLWERCRHDGAALDPLDEVVADTAPLAVCRAALQAVGVVPESI